VFHLLESRLFILALWVNNPPFTFEESLMKYEILKRCIFCFPTPTRRLKIENMLAEETDGY